MPVLESCGCIYGCDLVHTTNRKDGVFDVIIKCTDLFKVIGIAGIACDKYSNIIGADQVATPQNCIGIKKASSAPMIRR